MLPVEKFIRIAEICPNMNAGQEQTKKKNNKCARKSSIPCHKDTSGYNRKGNALIFKVILHWRNEGEQFVWKKRTKKTGCNLYLTLLLLLLPLMMERGTLQLAGISKKNQAKYVEKQRGAPSTLRQTQPNEAQSNDGK